MKPKIEAAAGVRAPGGKRAIIARLSEGPAALTRRDRNDHHEGAVNLHEYQAAGPAQGCGHPDAGWRRRRRPRPRPNRSPGGWGAPW